MSATDPKLNSIQVPTLSFHQPALVDTNALLKSAIQKLPPEVRSDVVLRCDELAHLQCPEDHIEKAFTQLLQMIVAEKAMDAKLYLYIKCSAENKKEKETIPNELQRFSIQFHTNITAHAAWMQAAEQRINGIASLLLPFGGSFLVNQLKNSGCIFCISLPGK